MEKFKEDLNHLSAVLSEDLGEKEKRKLNSLKNRLIYLREKNIVKINHSVMELVCAKRLILRGYNVKVEHRLTKSLVCDLYATRGDGVMILEIETGFVPPENALDPLTYLETRIASKISRYSIYSNKFGLGTPPHHILTIPQIFLTPPRERSQELLMELKSKCDNYYQNPPININELRYGSLHTVYVIHVDEGRVEEFDPTTYSENYQILIQMRRKFLVY